MGLQVFRIIREKLGWSQYKLAQEIGVSQSHLRYLEEKAKNTQTKTLIRLQKVSGLSPAKFWEILEKEAD